MSHKQFVVRCISGIVGLLALLGLFNRIVDPFWYYRDTEIKGFNAVKPASDLYERPVKPALLVREQPQAIVLGASYSDIGFEPTKPVFNDNGRLSAMNFAFLGASWNIVQCSFEFAATHSHIKRALVGFIPGDLPIADCNKDFAPVIKTDAKQMLLSTTALQASVDTIRGQRDNRPRSTREGRYIFYDRDALKGRDYFRGLMLKEVRAAQHAGADQPIDQHGRCFVPVPHLENTTAGLSTGKPLDLAGLRRLIKTARDNGIELVLYAYPTRALLADLEMRCNGGQEPEWQAIKQMAEMVGNEFENYHGVRIFEFYNYNDITAEPVGSIRYWYDIGHFTPEVGDVMLSDIYSQRPQKWGREITAANVEATYRDFLAVRSEYLRKHPEFQQEVDQLLH